jgi:hypothetical protein
MGARVGLAAACALALTFAGSALGSGTAGACSLKSAAAAVIASNLPQQWKDEARHKYGPNEGLESIACRDFTRDGNTDMEATFFSGGTAGDVAWVVFVRAGPSWKLAFARLDDYKLTLSFRGSDIVETLPVYRKDDGNCCPTGGYDHRRFHWNGTKFVLARYWHDKSWQV